MHGYPQYGDASYLLVVQFFTWTLLHLFSSETFDIYSVDPKE
jgi:hypothetical protein